MQTGDQKDQTHQPDERFDTTGLREDVSELVNCGHPGDSHFASIASGADKMVTQGDVLRALVAPVVLGKCNGCGVCQEIKLCPRSLM